MAWAPLKLGPIPQRRSTPKVYVEPKPTRSFEKLTQERAKILLGICGSVLEKSKELIGFVNKDTNRAKHLGIETIAIELSAIVGKGSIEHLQNALQESINDGRALHLSSESLANLSRAESNLENARRRIDGDLGQPKESAPGGSMWWPVAIIGVVIAGMVIIIMESS